MSKQIEALTLALEALEQWNTPLYKRGTAITAIKEALAQPEQEPVAWYTEDHLTDRSATTYSKDMAYRWECKGWPVTPLYTIPPQRKPLTNGEIYTAYITATDQTLRPQDERLAFAFARAIEAAHGIK